MITDILLIVLLIGFGLLCVLTRSLLRAAIALAGTSAILTIIMFKLNSPLAAVFELSVCTGLISVVFVSAISLTHPLTKQEVLQHMRGRLHRFAFLPILIISLGVMLILLKPQIGQAVYMPNTVEDVRLFMWGKRHLDLIGQILILLAGGIGVIVLFKDKEKK